MANNDYATIFWQRNEGVGIYDIKEVEIEVKGEPVVIGGEIHDNGPEGFFPQHPP